MKAPLLRSAFKTTTLVASLVECLVHFALLRLEVRLAFGRGPNIRERATWLHQCCARVTKRLGIVTGADASLPTRGLIVSNHLSHLDILLYGALGPVVFVSKKDVQRWPLLGRLATNGGTVFVDRDRGVQAAEAARQMEELLRGDLPVVLFPEGTSSDGSQVLPFRSPLFESAIRAGCPITAAAIGYAAEGADESALAYFGDKVFFSHLCETLGRRRLTASIQFASTATIFADRKEAARSTHELVSKFRDQAPGAMIQFDKSPYIQGVHTDCRVRR
jgi:1-acyl-sn-glycerol-3-phosphate acyltransferase